MAKKQKMEENASLLNVISPIALKFESNNFTLGENYCKGYGMIKYPPAPNYGWLTRITNIPSTAVSFTFTPNQGEILESINKNITMLSGQARTAKDRLKQQRAEKGAKDGMKLLQQIDENGEVVGELAGTLIPMAIDKESLKKVEQKMRGTCAMTNLKVRPLTLMQKHALQHVAPFYIENPLLNEVSNRVMPLRTFVGGFPFSSSGLNDNAGCYVAKDATGGLVVLDFWLRENDRTNSNFVIMGVHIMPIPKNDESDETEPGLTDYYDKDEGNGLGDLALYIKHLEIFFSLYIPSLTDKHKAVLKKTLIELYKDFDIDWNTDAKKLKPEDFPILSDMYNKLLEKASESKEEGKIETENIYEDLALFLEDAANGADSALWNGPTTLQTDKQITVLDTYSLQSTSNNVKRAQYFLLETWSWNIMSGDRTEKVALICDEAYLMIDPEVPQSLVFLRNVAKRDRKYEAGLFIISHSVVDFLDPKIKMYGQALLDTPCYKILFGTDGQNLEETDKLYNLTEAERELLESKRRGHALFMIGSKRLHVNFEIPDYKWEYFGKAGGR